MKTIKVIDIFNLVDQLQKEYKMNFKDIMELPVYLGDDEELNGVHGAYYCNEAMKKSKNVDIKALHNEIIEYDENAPDICVLIS